MVTRSVGPLPLLIGDFVDDEANFHQPRLHRRNRYTRRTTI